VPGTLKYHRSEKTGQYHADPLGGELADVVVCLALLALILDVYLAGRQREDRAPGAASCKAVARGSVPKSGRCTWLSLTVLGRTLPGRCPTPGSRTAWLLSWAKSPAIAVSAMTSFIRWQLSIVHIKVTCRAFPADTNITPQ
jgi:hypothetical protein